MKTKLIIISFAAAIIVSFSFMTINTIGVSSTSKAKGAIDRTTITTEPMSGFILEDKNQF